MLMIFYVKKQVENISSKARKKDEDTKNKKKEMADKKTSAKYNLCSWAYA